LTLAKLNFGLSATGCFGVHSQYEGSHRKTLKQKRRHVNQTFQG
jgi:hypothetical protein